MLRAKTAALDRATKISRNLHRLPPTISENLSWNCRLFEDSSPRLKAILIPKRSSYLSRALDITLSNGFSRSKPSVLFPAGTEPQASGAY